MKKNLGILHLSDIHASASNQHIIIRLVDQLKKDLQQITEEKDTEIKAICITGDLIHSGDNADSELDIVLNSLIYPVMEYLGITEECVYIVPGNHEVKRSYIVDYAEQGLASYLTSENNISQLLTSQDAEATKRIAYFDDYAELFSGMSILNDGICRAYIQTTGEHTLGFACINSAWRSTGIGGAEKGKMVVGAKQIIDSFEAISSADIKICLLHHPLDWLVDCDKTAVEKCIQQFDIVLNGHIHESSSKVYTTFNGHSLFNTCGKFDSSSDIYNGYSLISINPYNKECIVILRQYFDYPRNCYDKAIDICPDGCFHANLGDPDDTLILAYNITNSIKAGFTEYANKYFVSNVASGKMINSFDEAFIPPLFSEHSDYEKETVFERTNEKSTSSIEQISINTICNGKENLILLGRKESGKTTAIHYLAKHLAANFNELKTVPIVIDCQSMNFAGKNVLVKAAARFVNEYCLPGDSFSQVNIASLLNNGFCTIMFDGFDTVKQRHLEKINGFIKEYPQNRFIFCEKETFSSTAIADILVKPDCEYKKYHLCPLSKKQIRTYAQKVVIADCQEEKDALVDRILLCFKNTSLPRTPFILSVILSLCNNTDYSPINEAVVIEQFMELLLGKHSPLEAVSSTFDFRAKENFLIALVSEMHLQNRFYLTYCEFSDFVSTYHKQKGFDIVETKFDQIFFDNSVLVRIDQIVRFRYNCMIEYYLAKKASQEPEFLNEIMSEKNYIHYSNELLYYTGLNRNNNDILKTIQTDLRQYFNMLGSATDELQNYRIGVDISIPEDTFSNRIKKVKLTRDQSDQLSDIHSPQGVESPEIIDKTSVFNEGQSFIKTLFVFGNCLKNLEFIDRTEKEAAFNDYLLGLSIILAILKLATEENYDNEIAEMEAAPEQFSKQEIDNLRKLAQDVVKIALPIAIQNIALENVGTIKLKAIYESSMKSSGNHDFRKFFSTFILCDLRVPHVGKIIRGYVSDVNDKSLLKILFFKLLYYYQFRYFGNKQDAMLENVLADINLKLQHTTKLIKSHAIQELRTKRLSEKDIK